jgi:hypothetical protein
MPVTVAARQPGYFSDQDQADFAKSNGGDQSLEPGSMMAVGSGQAKILINNLDLRFGPPHLACPIDQLILPACALLIVLDLFGRGLADIDNRLQTQMTRFDLG